MIPLEKAACGTTCPHLCRYQAQDTQQIQVHCARQNRREMATTCTQRITLPEESYRAAPHGNLEQFQVLFDWD